MLELHTTEGFADWFQALGDVDAEAVAAGVELIEQLGPARAPTQTSDLVLWYQAPTDPTQPGPRFRRRLLEYPRFSTRVRGVLQQLESEQVRRRLADVSDERATLAFATLRRIAEHSSWRHLHVGDSERAWQEVQTLARSLYDMLGLSMPQEKPSDGLRELSLMARAPGLRVLYGVDAASSCGLLILGESLAGSCYGPSVRRALALWQAFLESSQQQRITP